MRGLRLRLHLLPSKQASDVQTIIVEVRMFLDVVAAALVDVRVTNLRAILAEDGLEWQRQVVNHGPRLASDVESLLGHDDVFKCHVGRAFRLIFALVFVTPHLSAPHEALRVVVAPLSRCGESRYRHYKSRETRRPHGARACHPPRTAEPVLRRARRRLT